MPLATETPQEILVGADRDLGVGDPLVRGLDLRQRHRRAQNERGAGERRHAFTESHLFFLPARVPLPAFHAIAAAGHRQRTLQQTG